MRKPTTEKQTVKEEIPKTIVKKLSAKKKKYEADISSPEKQLNKVKTTDKKSEFFTDVQKEKALPKVKQKPKGKHVRALYDIEKVDQSSENDFQINSKNDVKSKSKKRNPVKGKAKSKKAVQDTGNLKVEEGIDKNHEESCEELKGMSENSESESDWEEVEGILFYSGLSHTHILKNIINCFYVGIHTLCPSIFWSSWHKFGDIELKFCIYCQYINHQILKLLLER